MTFLITKADLPDYTKTSATIADLLIRPAIRDAHEFDVLPLLHASEALELAAYLADTGRPAFAAAYQAAEDAGFPEAELAALKLSPLYPAHVLYASAVRPLLCYSAYRRFLLDHGVHLTENGAETFSSGNNAPISGQQRTEMRADAAGKCSHYQARLVVALRAYRQSVASATACTPNRRRRSPGGLEISAL